MCQKKPPYHKASDERNLCALAQSVHAKAGSNRDGGAAALLGSMAESRLFRRKPLDKPNRSLAGINIENSGGFAPCSFVAKGPSRRLGHSYNGPDLLPRPSIMKSPATSCTYREDFYLALAMLNARRYLCAWFLRGTCRSSGRRSGRKAKCALIA